MVEKLEAGCCETLYRSHSRVNTVDGVVPEYYYLSWWTHRSPGYKTYRWLKWNYHRKVAQSQHVQAIMECMRTPFIRQNGFLWQLPATTTKDGNTLQVRFLQGARSTPCKWALEAWGWIHNSPLIFWEGFNLRCLVLPGGMEVPCDVGVNDGKWKYHSPKPCVFLIWIYIKSIPTGRMPVKLSLKDFECVNRRISK